MTNLTHASILYSAYDNYSKMLIILIKFIHRYNFVLDITGGAYSLKLSLIIIFSCTEKWNTV